VTVYPPNLPEPPRGSGRGDRWRWWAFHLAVAMAVAASFTLLLGPPEALLSRWAEEPTEPDFSFDRGGFDRPDARLDAPHRGVDQGDPAAEPGS
jgi:hypothetical protein